MTTARTLTLSQLEARDVPSAVVPDHPRRFAVGSGAGQPGLVSVYEQGTNAILTTLTPFGTSYTGGLRVAAGDLTGDGIDDVAVAQATGGGRVLVIDGKTQKVVGDFSAFSATSKGGAYIAIGDVTGDGRADLVAGAGEGNRPLVRVFRGQDVTAAGGRSTTAATVASSFFAFDPNFMGGVRVAVGDVTGDRMGDVLAAPGAGAAPTVKVFTATGRLTTELSVGGQTDIGGVFVAAGDVTGDGRAEVIAGRTVGTKATVTAYDVSGAKPKPVLTALGFTSSGTGGVPVAARDLDGDGKAEVIAAGGTGTSQVRVIGGKNGGLTRSFMAFAPTYRGGVAVG